MSLTLTNIGQIQEARLTFGDLTVLVGPQATGKSIALQFLQLVLDLGQVQKEMGRYGIDWDNQLPTFLDAYLGDGMCSVWSPGASRVTWEGREQNLETLVARRRKNKDESLFFIPAQRSAGGESVRAAVRVDRFRTGRALSRVAQAPVAGGERDVTRGSPIPARGDGHIGDLIRANRFPQRKLTYARLAVECDAECPRGPARGTAGARLECGPY